MPLPEESYFTSKSVVSDKAGYFKRIISGLKENQIYPLQVRWQYKDGTFGEWSLIKNIITPSFELGNDPDLPVGAVVGIPGGIQITWNGKDIVGTVVENDKTFDRADIHISGTSFGDGTKPAGNFKKSGTQVFKCAPGIYIVQIKIYFKDGTSTFFSEARTVTVPSQEEEVQAPVTPKGFTSSRVLSGIEVAWDGTYTGGAEWYGFQAINIYAGTSATATSGTYIKVGQMTANKTGNKIVAPVDGTYIRYDQPVYFHASSLNKKNEESSIVANVTSQATGARSAIPSDLADQIITNAKLVDGAVNSVKIATGAITEIKIDNNAITTAKIAAGAITEVKIDNSAITEAKIASGAVTGTKIGDNSITSQKIIAGEIKSANIAAGAIVTDKIDANAVNADKIASNSIYARNIVAGEVKAAAIASGAITTDKIDANAVNADKIASNSIYARNIVAGEVKAAAIEALAITTDKIATGAITAGKVLAGEIDVSKLRSGTISANNMEAGIITSTTFVRAGSAGSARVEMSSSQLGSVQPGFTIYGSDGSTPVFRADLTGTVSLTGTLTATEIKTNSQRFKVDTNGYLTASDVDLTGTIKASGGNIGGILISSNSIQNSAQTFRLDSLGKARFGSSIGSSLILNPAADVDDSWIYYSPDGGATGSNKFRVTSNGTLYASGAVITGNITANAVAANTTISGATINGGILNITGEIPGTWFTDTTDSDSGASAGGSNPTEPNSIYTLYKRTPIGETVPITCVGLNALALISTTTAGVVSSWYPYYDGASDLGVKYSPTYGTYPFRWRNLRLTGDIYIGGNGMSNDVSTTTGGAITRIYNTGRIFANTLGTSATTPSSTAKPYYVVQDSSGFLRVWVTSSSQRYKENINIINTEGFDSFIASLKPSTFNFKQDRVREDEYGKTEYGLIAEEVEESNPESFLLHYGDDGQLESVKYELLPMYFIGAIKELKKKIDDIQLRLDAIES